jgi:CRP/FNR family cyclic AMP-dependent transcriptional regulator
LLNTSARLGQVVASHLCRDCQEVYASVRCLALSITAPGRLARLVLRWAEWPLANQGQNAANARILVSLTHAEIGQLMGTTRETMSRTLREFREKQWIITKGSVWTITNEDALRQVAAL